VRRQGAKPVQSVVIVDERRRTRNVFACVDEVIGADAKLPLREVIESARVLLIDHFGIAGNIRAARIARRAAVLVVSDLENHEGPRFVELLGLIDHPIFSRRMAESLTLEKHPARAAKRLRDGLGVNVIVTCGGQGAWGAMGSGEVMHFPPFKVNAIDTTGCGDVFHGAYAAALARGAAVEERIQFASAAAALKATQRGGQAGIPTRAAVERFLRLSA
jgi:sugar/nucleoside kinase (ribokinase family)